MADKADEIKNEIALVDEQLLRNKIYVIRGQQVLLDCDLAEIYGYETRYLNLQVKHNINRFPEDFMFQLTTEEHRHLMLKNSTSNHGGRRKPPYAFTEQGVYQLATVLKGDLAEKQSIAIMRVFRAMRECTTDPHLKEDCDDYQKEGRKSMKKAISLILALVLVFAWSTLVFADDSADNAYDHESRGSNTKYFYDNIGNRYKVVGTTAVAGSYGSAYTRGELYRPYENDYTNFYGVTVYVTTTSDVYLSDYTVDSYTLSGYDYFSYPTVGIVVERNHHFGDLLINNLTCTHSAYTDHGGSESFITLVIAP